MSAITGHCFCKAVRFAYEGEPNWTLNCHCEDCRRAVSGAMATWISVPKGSFRFEAADALPRYARWRSDGPPVRHGPREK